MKSDEDRAEALAHAIDNLFSICNDSASLDYEGARQTILAAFEEVRTDERRKILDDFNIEIPPGMLAAGERAYHARDSRYMLDCDIVEDIFLTMMNWKPPEKDGVS